MLQPLVIALQLLTRIPVPSLSVIDPIAVGRSILFYPVVGLIIGSLLALVNWLLVDASIAVTAAILTVVWLIITGAIHIDGLADTADGWLGGFGNKEKTLEIMKDPTSGPAGVAAIVSVLLLNFSAMQQITEDFDYLALIAIPLIARHMARVMMLTTPYARYWKIFE